MKTLIVLTVLFCASGCATSIATVGYADREIEKDLTKVGVRVELKTTF